MGFVKLDLQAMRKVFSGRRWKAKSREIAMARRVRMRTNDDVDDLGGSVGVGWCW